VVYNLISFQGFERYGPDMKCVTETDNSKTISL